MCLIAFAYRNHPNYHLVLVANRDEFYSRPTKQAHFWEDHPEVLAGRDLEKMGTWMGVTKSGRFAAITNYREPNVENGEARSRGELVANYLNGEQSPHNYMKVVEKQALQYNGFNLIVGNQQDCFYFSNRGNGISKLKPGIYGLSNALLDTPWPKVVKSKRRLAECLRKTRVEKACLFDLLSDSEQAAEKRLPETGVKMELERLLSSVFIKSKEYGTRASTALLIDTEGNVHFTERSFFPARKEVHHTFRIERRIEN